MVAIIALTTALASSARTLDIDVSTAAAPVD
jgi:hypothetical protein